MHLAQKALQRAELKDWAQFTRNMKVLISFCFSTNRVGFRIECYITSLKYVDGKILETPQFYAQSNWSASTLSKFQKENQKAQAINQNERN